MENRKYTLIEGLPSIGYSVATFQNTNEQLIIPDFLSKDIKCLLDSKGFIQVKPSQNEDADENLVQHVISVDLSKRGGWNVIIDGQEIDDKVFYNDKVDYVYIDRAGLIVNIQRWIVEARQLGQDYDAVSMDEELDYLKTLKDNYIFSSQRENEYIALSDNRKRFNEICEEIIEANKECK